MKSINKRLLIIATVAALGLGSISAVAAPDCGGYGKGGAGKGHMRGDPEQRAQLRQQRWEARMQSLEANLQLSDEQQASWQVLKAAMEAQHQVMAAHRQQKRQPSASVPEHFDSRVSFMEARLQGMEAMAKAANDLYQDLSAEQQAVMDDFFAKSGRHGKGGKRAG